MKKKVHKLLEKGHHPTAGYRWTTGFIITLIILNVFVVILESIDEINALYGDWLHSFDIFSVIVFTIEFLARVYVSDLTHPARNKVASVFKFIFSAQGLIDLMAILPFYIPLVMGNIELREIRLLRLFRFLRVLKIHRYNSSIRIIWDVVREKRMELGVTGLLATITVTISAILMYHAEHPVQPDVIPDIRSAFWWAVATLTTVGYGDIYPITWTGRFIAGLMALVGIGLVALPTGLISVGFLEKIRNRRKPKLCPHCGKELPH